LTRGPAPSTALPAGVVDLLQAAVGDGVCPGAALGLVWADGRRLATWSGRQSSHRRVGHDLVLEPGPLVQGTTQWDLASLTKPMVVVTLLCRELASAQPRLRLDSTLGELLLDARHGPLADVTVQALLGHASGALAWADWFAATAHLADDAPVRAAALRAAVLATPTERSPGLAAVYSDVGYMSLGWALEAVCGAPLDALFERGIRRPLRLADAGYRRISTAPAMPEAGICATEIWPPRCLDGLPLHGEVHDDNCAGLDGVAGHAGLFASLGDVLDWAAVWLQATAPDVAEPVFLDPGTARLLVGRSAAPDTTWRLGWDTPSKVGSSAGSLAPPGAFGHLGFTGTSVWLDPDAGLGVVLLTQRVHPSRDPHGPIKALRPRIHVALWAWLGQSPTRD